MIPAPLDGRSSSHRRRRRAVHRDQQAQQHMRAIAGVDHELRNAIMPLLLHLDLLSLQRDGRMVPSSDLQAPVDAVLRLANGLLLRIADQAATTPPERIQLRDWWQTVSPLLRLPLPVDCALRARLPRSLPPVLTQPNVLAQILLHLVVHVRIGLSKTGPHHVRVTAWETRRGVTLSISDGAAGDSGHAPVRQPAALATDWGLSRARTLLAHSGAALIGASEAGGGTHCTIQLRAADGEVPPARIEVDQDDEDTAAPEWIRTRAPLAPAIPRTVRRRQQLRVLMIDDNQALTDALALRFGIESDIDCLPSLHVLHNSVAQIVSLAPSIVLLDLNLPGDERPIDVIRRLREERSPARVIVLTGNLSATAVQAARDAGAAGFIAKGVPPERLIAALRRVSDGEFVLELD
jgi:CheY-like chemotaxis protein